MPPSLIPRWHLASASRQLTKSALRPSTTTTTTQSFSTSIIRPSVHHPSPITDLDKQIPKPPPKKWITDLPARLGKCIIFGCSPKQIQDASVILKALATEWRELLAGSEGFLTGGRRGLDGREVVWGEMDSFGHVNNVNYYRYAESARVNWITNFSVHVDPAHRQEWAELMQPKAIGLIMKSLKCDFKFPMVYPDRISVYHRLSSPPQQGVTSFFLDCIVLSHQHRRAAARLEEDVVIYDYRKAGKTAMPEFMLNQFEKTWKLQQEETIRARKRIWELIGGVERLERETWDREDAKEDLGSAVKGLPS
ncbi:thioesterase-like superfamily-domain-containing protein [Neurospora tetraspora]|uniref:Thioesterase-like superfamily-domain-containing protein n=1 Tax=Neurospora tetraspora TaxID=94610 RepID=A0AAE0MTF5_9PEZI|nr:thioesterase-like superfamily-domain-containing protein [Neurospora tetraspora]